MDTGFILLPRSVLQHPKLSSTAKLLYAQICDFAYNGLYSCQTQEALGEKLDLSSKQIQNLLRELLEFGLIKVLRRGYKKRNYYIIVPLEYVDNLLSTEVKKVESEDYTITEADFEELVIWQDEFFSKVRKSQIDTMEKIERGLWGEMTSPEFAKYFAVKYKEVYGNGYYVSEAGCISIIRLFEDFDIKDGENRKIIIDTFIEEWDTHFKGKGYEKPTFKSLNTQWVREKLITLAYERIMRTRREEENKADYEVIEVIRG